MKSVINTRVEMEKKEIRQNLGKRWSDMRSVLGVDKDAIVLEARWDHNTDELVLITATPHITMQVTEV